MQLGSRRTRGVAIAALAVVALALSSPAITAQQPEPPPIQGSSVRPERRDATPERIAGLRVPPGFRVQVFAERLENARIMVVADDGTVYLSRRAQGDVLALNDRDGDGRAEQVRAVASGIELAHGLALRGNQLYLAANTNLYVFDRQPDGGLGPQRLIVDDLPDSGQHSARTLAFGPDGLLYINIGSACNACVDPNKERAALLRMQPDGSGREIYASGLRHTIGFGWHPITGALWGMDHGTDWLGDDQPPEELNRIVQDGNYGWPFCFGDRQPDRYLAQEPRGTTRDAYCAATLGSTLNYQAHSAPIGMLFYTATQFPAPYRNDAFVAMRGSWNREQPTGYKVVRLRFQDGQPAGYEDFFSGFLIEGGEAQFGRPAGLALARDGALLVADDTNGVIYRIRYDAGSE